MAKKPKQQHKTKKPKQQHETKKPQHRPSNMPAPVKVSSHYQVLGVDVTADAETIRQRYLDLVKIFSPEAEPEKFQVIRGAYEVLSNAQTRHQYDMERFYGASLQTLRAQAQMLMAKDRVQDALFTLEKISAIQPSADTYLKIAQAHSQLGHVKASDKAFAMALELATDDAKKIELLINHAYAIPDLYECIRQIEEIAQNYSAIKSIAIAQALFDLYIEVDRPKDAMRSFSRLISRRKIPTPHDWDVYLQWIDTMLYEGLDDELSKTIAKRVKPALLRSSGQPYLADVTAELDLRRNEATTRKDWPAAVIYTDLLLTLDPSNQALRTARRRCMDRALIHRQLLGTLSDFSLSNDFVSYLTKSYGKLQDDLSSAAVDEVLQERPDAPFPLGSHEVLKHMESQYPRLYRALQSELMRWPSETAPR